jgi:hypothetical protein
MHAVSGIRRVDEAKRQETQTARSFVGLPFGSRFAIAIAKLAKVNFGLLKIQQICFSDTKFFKCHSKLYIVSLKYSSGKKIQFTIQILDKFRG